VEAREGAAGKRSRRDSYSTILSKSLREARRAGLKTTISRPLDNASAEQKIAIEKVFTRRERARARSARYFIEYSWNVLMRVCSNRVCEQ
jgi:hypothetical protein